MTIKKNDFIGNLKTPIVELMGVSVLLPRGFRATVCLMNGHGLHELLRNQPGQRGRPQFASIQNGRMVSVFPRADKRYRLRVVGTQYVEQ